MLGKHTGVAAWLKKEAPPIFISGCPCHLIHLTAEKAAKNLTVDVGHLLIDIYYYYLEKSSKRKKTLKPNKM
ncbi:Uncharacterised protein r2_g2225 [Pycnogonum litorale]